ncbi:MAG: transporter, ATPase subunit [Acidobacteriales bacterium]|jgi:NitT/TauT family transport system ATP-binding protein|nr:transporter, ATPase subunit [Terriglobales bacterium]MEA2618046.1 sulfonate transport system ATP-binding protein [Chloroflexota bacterium]
MTMLAHAPVAAASPAPRPGPPAIRLEGVGRVFGTAGAAVAALDGISLEVGQGEFVCLVGASGCGKSTLLSLIAGLDRPTAGRVELEGGRPALMFQDAALLPWLTVARNVELPMRLRGTGHRERAAEVDRLLRLVHLQGFAERRPHQLSGGMRQRVALARALAQRTDVLLMDEPFAAVDAITRDLLHEDLARIAAESAMSVVFVTHNVREAVRLGDRVLLLTSRPGRVAEEFAVEVPRPRRIDDPAVGALALRIIARLREEIGRHGGG